MDRYIVERIGLIENKKGETRIRLDKKYAPALEGLEGFSHLNILWWFSQCDDTAARQTLQEESPYKNSPAVLGTFATRSPQRPNPIAMSCAEVTYIDRDQAVIGITYTDADPGTPVLDIKPYTPSLDRVQHPKTPSWCAHWPASLEASADFDWANEFNF